MDDENEPEVGIGGALVFLIAIGIVAIAVVLGLFPLFAGMAAR